MMISCSSSCCVHVASKHYGSNFVLCFPPLPPSLFVNLGYQRKAIEINLRKEKAIVFISILHFVSLLCFASFADQRHKLFAFEVFKYCIYVYADIDTRS